MRKKTKLACVLLVCALSAPVSYSNTGCDSVDIVSVDAWDFLATIEPNIAGRSFETKPLFTSVSGHEFASFINYQAIANGKIAIISVPRSYCRKHVMFIGPNGSIDPITDFGGQVQLFHVSNDI